PSAASPTPTAAAPATAAPPPPHGQLRRTPTTPPAWPRRPPAGTHAVQPLPHGPPAGPLPSGPSGRGGPRRTPRTRAGAAVPATTAWSGHQAGRSQAVRLRIRRPPLEPVPALWAIR